VKLSRALLAMAITAAAALCLCGSALAADVTVGPSLSSGGWETYECGFGSCIFANTELGGTGPNLASPVSGTVVRFNILGGLTAGTYTLRSMRLASSPMVAVFGKMSAPVAAVPNPGVQSYATSLPVVAGETIGLGMSETASVGFLEGTGHLTLWTGERPESGPELGSFGAPELVGFNAEIQPAPTISSLGTTSGPTAGGTSVTINGTDLENATSVSFGSAPAASYTVNSENQITAVAPANASATAVSVKVATIAGEATSSQQFGYVAPPPPPPVVTPAPTVKKTTKPKPAKQCVVPNLKGKKLPAAKAALKKADCKAGKVTKLKGATPKTGKVAAQSRKAGAKATAGAKVNLTLKP
jgi:IPT/TIG domain/PASTA domain